MSFDRIAPFYRCLETIAFGNALQRARACWIEKLSRPGRALIVGEGNGRFVCELARAHPKIEVDCVDASQRMLQLARSRLRRLRPESLARVRFFHRDIRNWSPERSYDLIVTHFFLDCFPEGKLEEIIEKLARAATPGARWLIADFTLPGNGFACLHARLWLWALYSFFRASTGIEAQRIIDPTPCL
ncbi:MAG: class I SAM-dependent methyltransferase, partial [Chthoniobacterales bacterium]